MAQHPWCWQWCQRELTRAASPPPLPSMSFQRRIRLGHSRLLPVKKCSGVSGPRGPRKNNFIPFVSTFWVFTVLFLAWTTKVILFFCFSSFSPLALPGFPKGKNRVGEGRTKRLKGRMRLRVETNPINFLPLLKLVVLTGPSIVTLAESLRLPFSKLWFPFSWEWEW